MDLLEEFEMTEQKHGDKGIKKTEFFKKHHERIDEMIEIGK